MDKIKIVFILGTLNFDGTQKQFLEIVRRLDRDRFDLRVLAFQCWGKVRTELEALRIPFSCLDFSGLKGKFHPASYVQLYKLIRAMVRYIQQEKPHIVQSFLFWTNIYGCIAAKIAGTPVIITGRRSIMDKHYMKRSYLFLQNLTNRWATAIFTNSQTVRKDRLQQEKNIPPDKIYVIYNGVESASHIIVKRSDRVMRKLLKIPDESRVVGIIGRLSPCKNHQNFLKAAVSILQKYPHTIFLIIGRDDGLLPFLKKLAKELQIHNSVIFTGERNDIPELLSIIDILVSASSTEGLSNAILEGMATGRPIVATKVGGTQELVIHEQTGLLVPPNDSARLAEAIIRLLGDKILREQLGKAGRQRAATLFSMERMVLQAENLYEQLVAGKTNI